jgi:hypothetical protein
MDCITCGEIINDVVAYRLQNGGVTYQNDVLAFDKDTFEDGEGVKWVCQKCMFDCLWHLYQDKFNDTLPANTSPLSWLSKLHCSLCDVDEGIDPYFTDAYLSNGAANPQASGVILIEECTQQLNTKANIWVFVPVNYAYVCFDCAAVTMQLPVWSAENGDYYYEDEEAA